MTPVDERAAAAAIVRKRNPRTACVVAGVFVMVAVLAAVAGLLFAPLDSRDKALLFVLTDLFLIGAGGLALAAVKQGDDR